MIARIWHGEVPLARADEYMRLMRDVALPDYTATPGNLGAQALRRDEDDRAHVLMLTFWESREAIVAFAGPDISVARYYDFDADFLVSFEPTVDHYEVTAGSPPVDATEPG